jgi:hypothetical protein
VFYDGKLAGVPGPASNWTNVNAGSELTVTDGAGTLDLTIARNASLNLRMVTKTATPASIVAAFKTQQVETGTNQSSGVYFYDGTKAMGWEVLNSGTFGNAGFRVQKYTNVTTASTTPYSQVNLGIMPSFGGIIYFQLLNAAGTMTFNWSLDGVTWHTAFTESTATFINPTAYGVGGNNQAAAGIGLTISVISVVAA